MAQSKKDRLQRKRRKASQARKRAPKGSPRRKRAKKRERRLVAALKRLNAKLRRLRIDWNGHEPIPLRYRRQRKAVRFVLRVTECFVSSTGRRDSDTYHGYRLGPRATDLGSNGPGEQPEVQAQRALLAEYGAGAFLELFGPDNTLWVKNGRQYTASEGEYLETLHDNHTHFVMA